MPNREDIRWFKQTFGAKIKAATAGTLLDLDRLTAIACQETGPTWSRLRKLGLSNERILALCVGDTLDFDKGRRAFPKTKSDLVAAPNGQQMFEIARAALVDMAQFMPDYQGAASKPNKFCHGFGLFQRDLQFFKSDPDYFLERRYERLEDTLEHCMKELARGIRKLGYDQRTSITDREFCSVAIAYNRGSYDPDRGLKQGHFDGVKYYGEHIAEYLARAREVDATPPAALEPGLFEVIARGGLKLRGGPGVNFESFRILPEHTILHVVLASGDWAQVDLEGDGMRDGFVHVAFIKPALPEQEVESVPEPE